MAYTYIKQGKFELIEDPNPELRDSRDAIVRVTLGSICTSDLHIKPVSYTHIDVYKRQEHKFRGALAKTLLYIGVPMGLQFSITAIGSIMLQSANNALGTACRCV